MGGFSLNNTNIFKLLSLTGYCKILYRKQFFTILAVSLVLYLLISDKWGASVNAYIT